MSGAQPEAELSALEPSESAELLEGYGVQGVRPLIKSYPCRVRRLACKVTQTAGHKEVRAWDHSRGATAPEAAGAIHGDFERGFIAADIVSWRTDLLVDGSAVRRRAAPATSA